MTIRSRPVLDRKHRPRWQDELRTQQLTVIGFAVAIALALGIFGAAAWSGYWEAHHRPVAVVGDTTFDRGDLDQRARTLTAEAVATLTELQSQLGGPNDQVVQQQIDSLSQQFQNLPTLAAQSLVDGAVLADQADAFGVSVGEDDVEAEVAERVSLPERIRANLLVIDPLPDDSEPDADPTDEQLEAARAAAQDVLDRIETGEDFAEIGEELNEDSPGTTVEAIGWFTAADPVYDEYFEALAGSEAGDAVGPIETDDGIAVVQLVSRREATADGGLVDLLRDQGIDDATYASYVRDELFVDAFAEHFADEVIGSSAAQQRVAQIVIAPVAGEAVPQERARHVLIQPDPDAEDQSEVTDEEWDASLEEANEVAELVAADDADWAEIAEEYSDDPGSAVRGGDLGWYDAANPGFVPEFAETLAELEVGEVSEPVRTDFGWHVIQKTGARESPQAQAAELADELRDDPDAFAETATRVSEDPETAAEGGELGWVASYQLDPMLEDAVFALSEVGEITDPIDTGTGGIVIFQLLESSDSREITEEQLSDIRAAGFDRWLTEEIRAPVETWVDPQYASSTAAET